MKTSLALFASLLLAIGIAKADDSSLTIVVEGLKAGDETTRAERILNTETIQNALKAASDKGIAVVAFPAGRFHFEGACEEAGPVMLSSHLWIRGSGREASVLVFHPTEAHLKGVPPAGSVGFHAIARAGVHVSDLGFENIGSRSIYSEEKLCYIPKTQTFANTIALLLTDCVNSRIENCSFRFGQNGLKLHNSTNEYEVNRKNTVSDCIVSDTAGYGLQLSRASSTIVENNHFSRSGTDGMKTGSFCRWLTIGRNISEENGRDGFDFYDGLLESTVTGNVARQNHLQGFDIKGNFDAEAEEYPSRENTFTGNVATRNGAHGFTVQQVRNTTFSGNQATLNGLSGFLLNGLQNCSLSGQHASKNACHGYYIISMSRSTFSGCMAIDNGWRDGVEVADTDLGFDGFFLEPAADGIVFSACVALNGTQTDQQGNQRFGMYFANYPEPVEKQEGASTVVLKFEAGRSEGNILTGGNFSRSRMGAPGEAGAGLGGNVEAQHINSCF